MTIIQQLEKRKTQLSHLNSPSNEEVYTPVALVEEMLDKLPKEIWTNPDLLWCDPCAKSGVFILEVIIRLMKSLPIEDETERHNHIINNMVKAYVNVKRNKWLVGKMIYGSAEEVERVGIIDDINKIKIEQMPKFDVVVGNPPYQANNNSGTESIWKKFIKISFDKILKPNGYLCFITPISWVSDNKSRKYILEKKKIYINIKTDIKKYFKGIGSSFSWFILKNSPGDNFLILDSDDGEINIDLNQMNHFPKIINSLTISIYKKIKIDSVRIKVINDNKYRIKSAVKTEQFKYPAYYTSAQPLVYTLMPRYLYNKKVIFSESGNFKPFFDDGQIGCVWHACHIPVNTEIEGNNLVNYLNSKIIKFIEKISRTSGWSSLSSEIPRVDLSRSWTDQELYEFFNLTQEEIDYIESQVK